MDNINIEYLVNTWPIIKLIFNFILIIFAVTITIIYTINKTRIYNEARWIRAIVLMVPIVGKSLDSLLYKKGNDTDWFTAGEDLESGDNCFLNIKSGKFYKASAVSQENGSTMIVKALQKTAKDKKGIFLIKGKYYSNNLKRGNLYLSTEPGKLTDIMPTGTDNVIRHISTGLNENEEYFSPSPNWMTHV